jgi:hypothetical protein
MFPSLSVRHLQYRLGASFTAIGVDEFENKLACSNRS